MDRKRRVRIGILASACTVLAGCAHQAEPVKAAPPLPPPPPPPDLHALYEQGIEAAAVKRPGFVQELTPIAGNAEVSLVTLNLDTAPPLKAKALMTAEPVWVALPDELAAKCTARGGDPLLALEELLGMPPESAGNWQLSSLTVSTKRVFRPCASSPDITTKQCSLEIARANGSQADFVYHQTWQSYQVDGDKPGNPFTGMGWTYDWGPAAPQSHFGVSEYVIRPGTHLAKVSVMTPQQFCQSSEGSGAATPAPPGTSPPAAASAPPAQ